MRDTRVHVGMKKGEAIKLAKEKTGWVAELLLLRGRKSFLTIRPLNLFPPMEERGSSLGGEGKVTGDKILIRRGFQLALDQKDAFHRNLSLANKKIPYSFSTLCG